MSSIITEAIGKDYRGRRKWDSIVKGSNNWLYLYLTVPKNLNVDPSSDELLLVGEEYDDDYKWCNIFSHGGLIYEIPCNAKQFLKFILLTKHSN